MRRGALVSLLLVTPALAACGSGHATPTTTAAPTAAQTTAQPSPQAVSDATAKSFARTAQTAAETLAVDQNGSYSGMSVAKLEQFEPALGRTSGVRLTTAISQSAGAGYTVTARASLTGDAFTVTRKADGTLSRTCRGGGGGCLSGTW